MRIGAAGRQAGSLLEQTCHPLREDDESGNGRRTMCYNVFMANTRSATFSVRLRPKTKKRLAKLAEATGRTSNFLISDAVESYVADQERLLAEVHQADRQRKTGHYVKHEDMKAWLLSWGTNQELPPPKCACGKEHDDGALCR